MSRVAMWWGLNILGKRFRAVMIGRGGVTVISQQVLRIVYYLVLGWLEGSVWGFEGENSFQRPNKHARTSYPFPHNFLPVKYLV